MDKAFIKSVFKSWDLYIAFIVGITVSLLLAPTIKASLYVETAFFLLITVSGMAICTSSHFSSMATLNISFIVFLQREKLYSRFSKYLDFSLYLAYVTGAYLVMLTIICMLIDTQDKYITIPSYLVGITFFLVTYLIGATFSNFLGIRKLKSREATFLNNHYAS